MEKMLIAGAVLAIFAATASAEKKEVSIKSEDGFVLKGTYYSAGKPSPGILLLHQCNADRKTYENLATMLANSGFNVVTMDFRGFGESKGGEYTDFRTQREAILAKFPSDVEAAYNFLISQPNVNAQLTGVAGASCGVNQAVQLGLRHPQVKTLVLLSGSTDDAGKAYVEKTRGLPILGAASEEDTRSAQSIQEIVGLSKNKDSKLMMFNGAGHGTQMFAKEKQLESDILHWFRSKLKAVS